MVGIQLKSARQALPFSTACIGAHNNRVVGILVLLNPTQDGRLSIQVVDGDVEEALDLGGVKIDGNHMPAPAGC